MPPSPSSPPSSSSSKPSSQSPSSSSPSPSSIAEALIKPVDRTRTAMVAAEEKVGAAGDSCEAAFGAATGSNGAAACTAAAAGAGNFAGADDAIAADADTGAGSAAAPCADGAIADASAAAGAAASRGVGAGVAAASWCRAAIAQTRAPPDAERKASGNCSRPCETRWQRSAGRIFRRSFERSSGRAPPDPKDCSAGECSRTASVRARSCETSSSPPGQWRANCSSSPATYKGSGPGLAVSSAVAPVSERRDTTTWLCPADSCSSAIARASAASVIALPRTSATKAAACSSEGAVRSKVSTLSIGNAVAASASKRFFMAMCRWATDGMSRSHRHQRSAACSNSQQAWLKTGVKSTVRFAP
mmetsp:Transcript_137162/g.438630  ORF Transcript_137162/g.438630 Transcript_137162/m.438630 type:complete len:360 (-) Transcript_137162:754-1833(-)